MIGLPRRRAEDGELPRFEDGLADELARVFDRDQEKALRWLWRDMAQFGKWNAHNLHGIRVVLLRRILPLMLFGFVVLAAVSYFENRDLSREPSRLARAIQASRFDTAYRSCKGSNARNLASVARVRVDAGGLRSAMPRLQRLQLAQTISLINAVVPYRTDCIGYARAQTALNVPSGLRPPKPVRSVTKSR